MGSESPSGLMDDQAVCKQRTVFHLLSLVHNTLSSSCDEPLLSTCLHAFLEFY
jgi:hypothetical protein